MFARKGKLKLKLRKLSVTLRKRQLARKIAKKRALGTRLLLLRVRRLAAEASMKGSKKRFSALRSYRRGRRKMIEHKAGRILTRITLAVEQKFPHTARTICTNKPGRSLYISRPSALRAARRRLRLYTDRYRRYSPRLARLRLRQYRQPLRLYRLLRRRQLRSPHFRWYNLQTIRTVLPFLRTRVQLTAWKRVKKLYVRASLRMLRRRQLRRRTLRRRYLFAPVPKQKRRKLSRDVPRTAARRAKSLRLGRSPFRAFRSSRLAAGMSLRAALKYKKSRRPRKRLRRYRLKKLKLWLSLKRASKRAQLRYRHRAWSWRLRSKKSLKKLPLHRPTGRAHRRKLRSSAGSKKHQQPHLRSYVNQRKVLRRRRKSRKRAFARGVRRFLVRCRRPRSTRSQLPQTRKEHTRRFFLRRAARAYSWLRLLARKVSRNAIRSTIRIQRPNHTIRNVNRQRKATHRTLQKKLLFLRAAVRARTKTYKVTRKMLRRRARQKIRYCRRARRLGRRRFLFSKWGKKHQWLRRIRRRVHREGRRAHAMQLSRGRSWVRWRRLPRHFFSRYARAVRQLFSEKPKLFRRGAWSYFYRDREFTPRARRKLPCSPAELDRALYLFPKRSLIPRPRPSHTHRAQWYTFRNISRRARTTLSKKHKGLGCLIRRRLRAQRQLVSGAVYGFQESNPAVFSVKADLRKALRRLYGRKVRGRRQRYKGSLPQRLPRVICLHPTRSRRVPTNTVLVGSRLQGDFSQHRVRPARSTLRFPEFRMLRKQFTQELQQELAVITGYAPIATPSSAKPLTQRTVLRTAASRRKQRFVRKARRAVVWFKALRHQLVIVKRRLRRAQRSRHKRKPRAWRRLLNTLDFEFVLDSTLGTALRFLDKAHAKIQPKIKTKVQLKTKEDKPVQARVHPQKVQKISSTPHKSWPTSPRSTTRARPTAPQSYKKQ